MVGMCTNTTTIGRQFCKWVDLSGRASDELIDRDIRRSIDEQFARKALTKAGRHADLYVGYQAVIHLEKGINLSAWGKHGGLVGLANGPDWRAVR